MIQKIKTLIMSLSLLFAFSAPVLVTSSALAVSPAFAQTTTNISGNLCKGSNLDLSSAQTGTGQACQQDKTSFTDIVRKVINILSVLVGAIAVIMIIIGGFRYVTSGGSESGVSSAKKTILYALIGLVIVALAQVVVHFVLNNINP